MKYRFVALSMMVKRPYAGRLSRIHYVYITANVFGGNRYVITFNDKMMGYSRVQLIDVRTQIKVYEV